MAQIQNAVIVKNNLRKRFLNNPGLITVLGLGKNAGKTSFLNWLGGLVPPGLLGVFSTGRDGEAVDVIFGHAKPPVVVKRGTLFCATSQVIGRLATQVKVCCTLPWQAGGQRLWLAKTLLDCQIEISGPAAAANQQQLANLMFKYGAKWVLVDGSLDRKGAAFMPGVNGVYLVAGASAGKVATISKELTRLAQLSKLPVYPFSQDFSTVLLQTADTMIDTGITTLWGNETLLADFIARHNLVAVLLPGALTEPSCAKLAGCFKKGISWVVKHPLAYAGYQPPVGLAAINGFSINGVAVNSADPGGNHLDAHGLLKLAQGIFLDLPVTDTMLLE